MSYRLRFAASLVLPLVFSVAGCGPKPNTFAPPCPTARLIPALADVTRYSGPGPAHDLTDMILQARVLSVNGKCEAGKDPSIVAATVNVSISVQRGPAMKGREADITVFLAVTEGDTVRDKKTFPVHVVFPPNVDRMAIGSGDINLDLPVSKTVSGASYGVIVGFQLTPEELKTNEQMQGG